MRRGTKRLSAQEKQTKGTYRPSRDAAIHVITNNSVPICPTYLTPEAQAVWHEELDRVVAGGICGLDTSFYASYCALEAIVRDLHKNAQLPQAATLTELRRRAEMLGIAGPSSRALLGTQPETEQDGFASLPEA